MLALIYSAYSIMTFLYETVPANEDAWIECHGDLGRKARIIEDGDIQNVRAGCVWTEVVCQLYLKACDRVTRGRKFKPSPGYISTPKYHQSSPNDSHYLVIGIKSIAIDVRTFSRRKEDSSLCTRLPTLRKDLSCPPCAHRKVHRDFDAL